MTAHAPIAIVGNSAFTPANGVSWGSGTQANPYIIENWEIDASSADGIAIKGTTAYFVIRNCYIYNGMGANNGIYLSNVANGTIQNNTSRDRYRGIRLENSTQCLLTGNTVTNTHHGISLASASSYNTIVGNNCSNNNLGPTLYSVGIYLYNATHNTISNNVADNNYDGIYFEANADYNLADNNVCEHNAFCGLAIDNANNNTLSNNSSNYNDRGINLNVASNNLITNNTCSNNIGGIYSYSSPSNTIILNSLNNSDNAHDSGTNAWDNNGKGNYWSDWQPPTHPDSNGDGIVDAPRLIAGGSNQDRYPLVIGAPQQYTLTIQATTGGTTNPAPGTYAYIAGATATVTATPNQGYLFDHWELDGVSYTGGNVVDVLMNANYVLLAVFVAAPTQYRLTISAQTNQGTTSPSPGTRSYTAGTAVNVTAIPKRNYSFNYWTLDGARNTTNPISVLMNANHTLVATFMRR